MSFINELRRRNVFRVGIAYVVVAWLVLQVADVMIDNIGAPDWLFKAIVLVLGLGFPVVLVFAWAFEMTPEGIKREHEVDRTQSIAPRTGRKLDFVIIGVLAVAVVYLLWEKLGSGDPGAERVAEQPPADVVEAPKSIAVLPFVNMSEDAANEYFSDGISEEILNALAQVDDLKVAGRTSSFAFKGRNQDLRQIGEALGVAHILEGSVRKAGNQVRITAQLVKADDGFHLWSDTFDRELTNVFAIQDEIAQAILAALQAELLAGEDEALAATRTDARAYDLYLLARQRMGERNQASLEAAAALLDEALAIDPGYAPALAQRGITTLLLQRRNYGEMTTEQAHPIAKSYIDRALAADPELGEAWAARGLYLSQREGEVRNAIESLEKALAINPNLIDASNWLQSAYSAIGDHPRARSMVEAMFERDPLYRPGLGNIVLSYCRTGEKDKANAALERAAALGGDEAWLLESRAVVRFQCEGDAPGAMALLDHALELAPAHGSLMFQRGLLWLHTHQYEPVTPESLPAWQRIYALHALGRLEEASILAYERAAEGDVTPLLALMNREGRPADVVRFFEERWTDLDEFLQQYPSTWLGDFNLLELAWAFARTGHERRFQEAMRHLGSHFEELAGYGVRLPPFLFQRAAYFAMAGAHERALDELEAAIDNGGTASARIAWEYPMLAPLEGEPRYEALQQRMLDRVNRDRAALGLEPVDG